MSVPNTFNLATGSIPLSQLDANFAYYDAAFSISGTTITFAGTMNGNLTGNVSGNAGTVTNGVYLANTQTLTNKTISGSSNTLSNIGNASLTNSAITINGSAISLGGTVSVGTVTSVTGTSPVVSSGGATPAISMAAANTTTNGYLTSTDWNTFNNKQPAGTYVNSVSGTTGRTTSTGGTTPVIDLASGIATAGTTGSSTLIPVVTVDTYGRVTSLTTAANPQGTVTSVGGTGSVNGLTLTGTVTSTGNLTLGGTLSGVDNSALTNSAITFGSTSQALGSTVSALNAVSVGQTTAAAGSFTTLSASSTVSGTGFSTYLASPPAIGGTAAAAGSFTALSYSTTLTGGTGIVNLGSGQFYKDASGNVGIGTSSPSAKLDVVSTASATASSATGILVGPNSGSMSAGDLTGLGFRMRNSVGGGVDGGLNIGAAIYGIQTLNNGNSGGLAFYTRLDATTLSERARIDSSGNLLVGRASIINQERFGYTTTTDVGAISNRNGGLAYYPWSFTIDGTTRGYIYTTTSSTTYATSSDYRLKENVQPMTGALSVVQQLKPCTYNWKADGSDGQGFIAHELQAIVPDCVTGEKDAVEVYTDENGVEQTRPKYQGIDTSFLVATLTAAIQELNAKFESYKEAHP